MDHQSQHADPSFELFWRGRNNGIESDGASLLSSDESSNEDNNNDDDDDDDDDDNDGTGGMASLLCFSPECTSSARAPLVPILPTPSTKENYFLDSKHHTQKEKINNRRSHVGQKSYRFVALGVENTAKALTELESMSDHDSISKSTSSTSRSLVTTTNDLSGLFLCTALNTNTISVSGSLLDVTKAKRKGIFSRKSSDLVSRPSERVMKSNLPEDHGPIRRHVPFHEAISSTNSEATTDHANNVSFAKLACMIITSQAAKKVVEPMDRIAAILELKGVGRGTTSLRELRESNSLRLFLDDYSEANYWPMLDSLCFNKCLQKLVVFRNGKTAMSRVRTDQEMDCFFRVLTRLTSTTLSELHLWNFGPDDQSTLCRGLAYNTSLEYIQIHLETGAISPSLCRTLATLPKLVSLEIEVSSSFAISELLSSTSLGVLSVICTNNPFYFDSKEILRFAKKLEANTTLSVLSIEPCISSDASLSAILHTLKTKNRSLETFQFSSAAFTVEEGDGVVELMLNTLHANSHLRVLWNHLYESWSVSANMRQKVLGALQQHKTIQQFHIFPEAADFWFKKNNILQNNVSPQ